jgi:hypothetical protein
MEAALYTLAHRSPCSLSGRLWTSHSSSDWSSSFLGPRPTLVQLLVMGVVRRRQEVSLLKALGFVRRQVAVSVWWQAFSEAGRLAKN